MYLPRLLLTILALGATPALAQTEDEGAAEGAAEAPVVEPALDGESSRAATRALVEARWGPRRGPKSSPRLEAALDELAREMASGVLTEKKLPRAFKRLVKDGLVGEPWSLDVYTVFVGESPNLGGLVLPGKARYLAVGQGTGDLGEEGGAIHTVLLVATADTAE